MKGTLIFLIGLFFGFVYCDVCSVGSTCSTLDEYDFVIIGSGASGSVLADKLSKDGKHTVLILEAGPLPDEYTHCLESSEWVNAAFDPRIDWGMTSLPHAHLNGRTFLINQGKVVGGCSSHNAQFWVFGNKHDWDTMEKDHGAEGWNWDSIKSHKDWLTEQVKPRVGKAAGDGLGVAFEAAARGAGWPISRDYNNPEEGHFGWSVISHNTEIRDGKTYRKGVYQVFLKPALQRSNLHLLANSHVSRVIVNEDKEVQYVEYYPLNSNEPKLVKVRKEAIISAGTIRTPQVLMLSGIGPEDHLKEHDIKVVVDLPGVGVNLQDHVMFTASYKLKSPTPSDSDYWGNHLAFGRFDGSWNETTWADWQLIPITRQEYIPGFPIVRGCEPVDNKIHCVVFLGILLHPFSKGHVRLISSNYLVNPSFTFNYGSDQRDIDSLRHILQVTRSILLRPELSDWVEGEIIPGISKSSELEAWIKSDLTTVWHPVGSAKIGKESDYWSVVDSRLRVKGVKGLRVADASVFPILTSGNTHLPSLIVGSKAADMLLEDNYN